MVAWAAIIPAIGAAAKAAVPAIATGLKAAGGAVATGAKTLGSKVAASKLGGALATTGKNALQSRLMGTAIKNIPNGLNSQQTTLANALSGGGNSGLSMPKSQPYEPDLSMVDYSQYMGLSPITQRYLYGGM